jgi:hypothetical protein
MRRALLVLALLAVVVAHGAQAAPRPYPILFVTQVPMPDDFTSVNAVFGNHKGRIDSAPRGGDLWVLYPDNSLRNLTQLAGWGHSGVQGANSIQVREPSVDWTGTKAVFSMVVGAPTQQFVWVESYWQIYEISGLGETDTPVITKVRNQPTNFNNVSPIYGTDGRIIFTSDRPRDGQPQLYPQLDEYESQPTVTGLWKLDASTGDLQMLNHTISGVFSPSIDSFGRLVFVRWDHLQRDQQADADTAAIAAGQPSEYGTFDYADETAGAAHMNPTITNPTVEIFPESRFLQGVVEAHEFNQFFPWATNEDGTGEEIVNHVGRHDLAGYFDRAFNDNPDLVEFDAPQGRVNKNSITNFIQVKESPSGHHPGRFFAIDAPEFATHASGQLVTIDAPPTTRPDLVPLTWWTDRSTATTTTNPTSQPNVNSGHYRNPLPLSDDSIIVSHTYETRADLNGGTTASPISRYDFRLKVLTQSPAAASQTTGAASTPGTPLTGAGIQKTVSWFNPDTLVSYNNVTMWELDPVEVRSRTIPVATIAPLPTEEQSAFTSAGVDPVVFSTWLKANNLALLATRNVTTRDSFDHQQPFNLHVKTHAGVEGATTTGNPNTRIYDVTNLEIFQADQVRGMGGATSPKPGRRPLARRMHDDQGQNAANPNSGAPVGSIPVASDGSVAALVPAHRALSWQLASDTGTPVVHERYWLTFQPGELRVCSSCHGLSHSDQAGNPEPTNVPVALTNLLINWKTQHPAANAASGFYAVTPCRVFDTRQPDGPGGGPQLVSGGTRQFYVGNRCSIPPTAMSVSINVTVTQAAAAGSLTLFAGDQGLPGTSSINFNAADTRANNQIVALSADGTGAIKVANTSSGATHVILDVNGYFMAPP